ncbi:MAG: MBL fold metallo-hydrolase RNA specificity domain-containing protein [Chloroflexota bacterium]
MKVTVRLTFYDGVGTIGGNKILLEDLEQATNVFLDFGTSFGKRGLYFEEYLKPRSVVGLLDLLEMELLPPLRGIYRDDLVVTPQVWDRVATSPLGRELSVNGVLLSHAHVDHSGYISFLRPDIPIFTSTMTALIARAMQDSSPADFEREVAYLSQRELTGDLLRSGRSARQRPFIWLDAASVRQEMWAFWSKNPAKTKSWDPCPPLVATDRVGGLHVRSWPVDHSIFGAVAYAVETSSGWIVYTGDLRLHGTQGEFTRQFAEEARALEPKLLLCEGTRAHREERITEEMVLAEALAVAAQAPGLLIGDFGPRNVERLLTFLEVARATKRRLVVTLKDAYLLEAMHLANPMVPTVNKTEDMFIYNERKGTVAGWEDELRQRCANRILTASQVHEDPRGFLLCLSFFDINELIDIDPSEGAYIYSSSEAYDEEQVIDMKRLKCWLEHFHLRFVGEEHGNLHASGHASGPELLELARIIEPEMLVPIHTERPDYFASGLEGTGIRVRVVGQGESLAF